VVVIEMRPIVKTYVIGILAILGMLVAGIVIWHRYAERPDLSLARLGRIHLDTGITFPEDSRLLAYRKEAFKDVVIQLCVSIPRDRLDEFRAGPPIKDIVFREPTGVWGRSAVGLQYDLGRRIKNITRWECGQIVEGQRDYDVSIGYDREGNGTVCITVTYL
jgi:hypothetical protein